MDFYQSAGLLFFGSRLKRLSGMFLGDVNRIYRAHNIRFDASWFPVFYILSAEGEVSIRYLAEQLHISHSAASQMVSALHEKGLVKSTVSATDARHKVVRFTAKGEKLLQKVRPVWEAIRQSMEELTTTAAVTAQLPDALTALEQCLQQQNVFERVNSKLL